MRVKLFFLLALVLFGAAAYAEDCSEYPGACIDQSAMMTPKVGAGTDVTGTSTNPGGFSGCINDPHQLDCGAFREGCQASHMGFDDPIVNRGGAAVPFASHAHVFYGLVGVDYLTDVTVNPQDEGSPANSTCNGGAINRTLYWNPVLIDTRTGKPLVPDENLLYYKVSQQRPEEVQRLPEGLRFIAGDATRTSDTPAQPVSGVIRYQCKGDGGPSGIPDSESLLGMKDCPVGAEIWALVEFGQCLAVDGVLPGTGTFSGTMTGWRAQASVTDKLVFRSTTLSQDVAPITVSGGGGAAAPVIVTELPGSATAFRTEKNLIQFVDLTAGQSVTVAGRTYTSTGASTAEEIVLSFSGGSPEVDSGDHKSHAAQTGGSGVGPGNCPTTHPYPISHIRFTIEHPITDAEMTQNVRWSCDIYKGPAGYCLHADWRFGWKEDNHLRWLEMTRHGFDTTNLQGKFDADGNEVASPYVKYNKVIN